MKNSRILFLIALFLFTAALTWFLTVRFGIISILLLRNISLLFAAFGLTLIFFQFVLASRVRFLERQSGLDGLMRLHRFCGRAGLALLFLHFTAIIIYRSLTYDPGLNIYIVLGIIALLGFIVTGALASTYKKIGLHYEIWRNAHLFNYLLFPIALGHVFYHAWPGTPLYYYWVILAALFVLIACYRLVRIYRLHKNPYTIASVKQEAVDAWSLFFKGPVIEHKPGQFLFLQLVRDGRRLPSHPFTISSPPGAELLSVTPKELGDFTSTIKHSKPGEKALIDAPYGVFSYLNWPAAELVFIAGGIGITPFMSMLRYMRSRDRGQKVTLFWGNRSEKQLCFRDELREMEKELDGIKTVLVMSGQPEWPGERGYIDEKLLLKHLESFADKEFFVCGPPVMTKLVAETLAAAKVPAARIHSELFDLTPAD